MPLRGQSIGETMADKHLIEIGTAAVTLESAPINPGWILEGNPVARNFCLSASADGTASSWIWDCSAGKFNWYYNIDETVYVLEGSIILKDHAAGTRVVNAGDTVFFPAGSSAEWTVPQYVRKVAFLRAPLPRPVQFARRVYRAIKRLVRGDSADTTPAMFPSS